MSDKICSRVPENRHEKSNDAKIPRFRAHDNSIFIIVFNWYKQMLIGPHQSMIPVNMVSSKSANMFKDFNLNTNHALINSTNNIGLPTYIILLEGSFRYGWVTMNTKGWILIDHGDRRKEYWYLVETLCLEWSEQIWKKLKFIQIFSKCICRQPLCHGNCSKKECAIVIDKGLYGVIDSLLVSLYFKIHNFQL